MDPKHTALDPELAPDDPPISVPDSTYRLQFTREFGFRDALAILPYLAELGIDTIYASPIFHARSGSTHGYDVVDPNHFNPELGTAEDVHRFERCSPPTRPWLATGHRPQPYGL
jgi:hypothetical protein